MANVENISEEVLEPGEKLVDEGESGDGQSLTQAQIEANLLQRANQVREDIRVMEAGMYMTQGMMESFSFQTPGQHGVVHRVNPSKHR
jgi:hypothetical protein